MRFRDVLRPRGEDVEDEAAARHEQVAHACKHLPAVVVRVHVQQRPKRADHERYPLGDRRFAQVADAQVEVDAGEGRTPGAHLQHRARRVDPDHADSVGRDRHGDAAGADAELHDRPSGAARLLEVEPDILDHARAPRVVQLGNRVVWTGHPRYRSSMAVTHARFAFSPPRLAGDGR